jgi:sulfonate transport system permease protein
LVTLRGLILGSTVGLLMGVLLGLLREQFPLCRDTLGTTARRWQMPSNVCWVPLALLWFGQTETATLFIVVMGSLWSILPVTDASVHNVPPN